MHGFLLGSEAGVLVRAAYYVLGVLLLVVLGGIGYLVFFLVWSYRASLPRGKVTKRSK